MTEKHRRLGRGLDALLAMAPQAVGTQTELRRIRVTDIRPNPYQPRREFKAEELAALEASLKANGLLQPVVVREASNAPTYELIAGERRLRAAANLGWTEISALVKHIDDRTLLTLALVENLQRSDLNAIEEAQGYHRLMEEFGLTQQQVADIVAKDRSTVANLLRLLSLPPAVRNMVETEKISVGHARALLAGKDAEEILAVAQLVVAKGLTVRKVERLLRAAPDPQVDSSKSLGRPHPFVRDLEDQLRRRFQTDVQLALTSRHAGSIKIAFYSDEDLERILEIITHPEAG